MQSEQRSPSTTPDESAPAIAGDALARRRLLLKGLGKGSAAIAVLVPIQTLAAVEPLPARLCTVSGVQSNVGSGRTGGTTTNCRGYAPGHFATLSNWPGFVQGSNPPRASFLFGSAPITDSTTFRAVFGSGSNTQLSKLFTQPNQDPAEVTFAAAFLSAVKKAPTLGPSQISTVGYFPYTPQEVVAFFSATNKAAAEAFFRDYLQTLP